MPPQPTKKRDDRLQKRDDRLQMRKAIFMSRWINVRKVPTSDGADVRFRQSCHTSD
jgi:hypothetical protein